jgi:dihydroorotate dehydrogenase
MYQQLLKPLLFLFPPEQAHNLAIQLARFGFAVPIVGTVLESKYNHSIGGLERKLMGLNFPNPVGLAAGFDKDGKYIDIMSRLGFGFLEIGTVTPKPQIGNPKPRLFRLPADSALINRMGFNNDGVEALVRRLDKIQRGNYILGGNIGKNKDTDNENALHDYLICLKRLYDHVDYFVINVSSPNTPGLRALQDKEPLGRILHGIQEYNLGKNNKPVLLKIAPDITEGQAEDIASLVTETGLAGLVATNTTIQRDDLKTSQDVLTSIGNGGLSGSPVKKLSNQTISILRKLIPNDKCLIGVGGILEPSDAIEKMQLGADLIQIYTGLIYSGPDLPARINKVISIGYDI